jgi:serine/threonine protein kinase
MPATPPLGAGGSGSAATLDSAHVLAALQHLGAAVSALQGLVTAGAPLAP